MHAASLDKALDNRPSNNPALTREPVARSLPINDSGALLCCGIASGDTPVVIRTGGQIRVLLAFVHANNPTANPRPRALGAWSSLSPTVKGVACLPRSR
jgi:hypothetical protein